MTDPIRCDCLAILVAAYDEVVGSRSPPLMADPTQWDSEVWMDFMARVKAKMAAAGLTAEQIPQFRSLVSQWHKERGATSSITKMAMSPSHLRIIAMGPEAVPLILREMENEGDDPDMWFVALQILTNADPVTDDTRGNFKAMADQWLNWARCKGYAW